MNAKQLTKSCNTVAIVSCILYVATVLIIYLQSRAVGANYTANSTDKLDSMHELWVGLIIMAGLASVCALFFTMTCYVRKGKLFTVENERNLLFFGLFSGLTSAVSALLIYIFALPLIAYFASALLVVIGISLFYFSLLFKISRKLNEEQDLTI